MMFIVSEILRKGQWGAWNKPIGPSSKWKRVGRLVKRGWK